MSKVTKSSRVLDYLIQHEGECVTPKGVAKALGIERACVSSLLSRYLREIVDMYRPRQGHYLYDTQRAHINFDTRRQEFLYYIAKNKTEDGYVNTVKMQEHMGMETGAFYSELSRIRADNFLDYEMVHFMKLGDNHVQR